MSGDLPHGTFAVRLGEIPVGRFTLPDDISAMEQRLEQVLALVSEVLEHSGPVSVVITPVTD